MTSRAPLAARVILALASLLVSTRALAQIGAEPVIPPWVQVELVLFRQLDGTRAGDETWPPPRALSYPEPIEILLEPGSPALAAAQTAREFDAALAAGDGGAAATPVNPTEMPFVRLPSAAAFLAPSAERLARSPRHHVLSHIVWRQPLPAADRPVRVLITAGAQTQAHYEVEGYLTLSRSRYLHADARLWLNEFATTATQHSADGVLLPEVPLPRMPQPAPGSLAMGTTGELVAGNTTPGPGALFPEAQSVTVEPLRATRTVLLEASRRLAPGEVHFLDHPLFGALLSVSPWDPATGAVPATDVMPGLPPEGAEETPPPD